MTRLAINKYNIIIKAHYVTETITEEKTTNVTGNTSTKDTTISQDITPSKEVSISNEAEKAEVLKEGFSDIESIRENIAKNNAKLDEIISRNEVEKDEINKMTLELSSNDNNRQATSIDSTSIGSLSDEQKFDEILSKVEKPTVIPYDNIENPAISETMLKINSSIKLVGHSLTEKLGRQGVALTESQAAEERQKALCMRIQEFVESFNVTRTVSAIGLTLGIGYTIFHILRYREIPFGGFIKGFLTNHSPTPSVPSDIISTNNITIQMPSIPDAVKNAPTGVAGIISQTIENLGPWGIAAIGVTIWLLKRK